MMNKRFWDVVKISFALPLVFAILDVIGANLWEGVGGWDSQAYIVGGHIYQYALWALAYVLIGFVALTYYLVRKDKSESIALAIIPVILLQCGVEDVIFYWMKGLNVADYTMPWLMNHLWPPTIISNLMGFPVINGSILLLTSVIGIILSYKLAKKLEMIKG